MSSVSRDCDSVPPIASIADAQDGEQEHAATDPSSGTEDKSDSEFEASDDRASTPPVSRDQSHRASPVQADLIPNPGFSHVRSWLRVPVPAGRDAELGVIKREFKDYVDETLPLDESWRDQRRSRRADFIHDALKKWPVMKCYEDGWPIEAMARQVLIERKRGKAKATKTASKRKSSLTAEDSSRQGRVRQQDKVRKREKSRHENKSSRAAVESQTRLSSPPKESSSTALASSSTTKLAMSVRAHSVEVIEVDMDEDVLPVAKLSPRMGPTEGDTINVDEDVLPVAKLSPEISPIESDTQETMISARDPEREEALSHRESMERALVALLGESARPLVPLFVCEGICTLDAFETFVHWTHQEQRTFMKEDLGLTAYEAMEVAHRLAQREQ